MRALIYAQNVLVLSMQDIAQDPSIDPERRWRLLGDLAAKVGMTHSRTLMQNELDTAKSASSDGGRVSRHRPRRCSRTPENTLWIGDASGTWQDGRHSLRGRVSFDVFKQRRWRIEAPQKKRTNHGDHPRNPAREDRIALVNNLLAQGRLYIDGDTCPDLLLALKKCELKNGKPVGKYAHSTDALGYALWWLEPRPKARVGVPKVGTVEVRPDRANGF
jgi:hypothetical protein